MLSHPDCSMAGVMNFAQMSASDSFFLVQGALGGGGTSCLDRVEVKPAWPLLTKFVWDEIESLPPGGSRALHTTSDS